MMPSPRTLLRKNIAFDLLIGVLDLTNLYEDFVEAKQVASGTTGKKGMGTVNILKNNL